MIFWKLIKNIALGSGTPFRDRKSLRTKQTQVKLNAKRSRLAHKSSHPHPTAPGSWAKCAQNLPGSSPHKVQMGHSHTVNFNAMLMVYRSAPTIVQWVLVNKFSCISYKIHRLSYKKMSLKMSYAKWQFGQDSMGCDQFILWYKVVELYWHSIKYFAKFG